MRYFILILIALASCKTKAPQKPVVHNPAYDIVMVLTSYPVQYQLRNGMVVNDQQYSALLSGKPVPTKDTLKLPPLDIPLPDTDLNWPDRRPIGMIMLASYTGSTGTDNYVTHDFLAFADNCVENMKEMDAQGMISWDIEGQKFSHPASYIGDPRFLPVAFDTIADRYFAKFEGFKTGICIRPDSIAYNQDSTYLFHYSVADPYTNMEAKIQYAIDRWGCSLFYIDSNVWPGRPGIDLSLGGDIMTWWVFKRLHDRFPKVLLIPEWQDYDYFKCSAPFYSSAEGTILLSDLHKQLLPNSFLVAAVDQKSTEIEESVRQGNVMLFAAWWKDPNNQRIKQAYENISKRD